MNNPAQTKQSVVVKNPNPHGGSAFNGGYREEALQARFTPQASPELDTLLKQIDAQDGKLFTAEGAALLKQKLKVYGKENFSITLEQGGKAFELAQQANDPEYISKALLWGGVTLLEKAPNREAFISYARVRYPEDYSSSYRKDLNVAATDVGPAFSERWKNLAPAKYHAMIENYSIRFNINPNLAVAIMKNESNFDPGAQSSVGAKGLMQVMPGTAVHITQKFNSIGVPVPDDPIERNIAFGIYYLREMSDMFRGDTAAIIRAYNAGPGNEKSGKSRGFRETTNYLAKVTKDLDSLSG
jgi:soluble lytic murein transglycosylase-like protein